MRSGREVTRSILVTQIRATLATNGWVDWRYKGIISVPRHDQDWDKEGESVRGRMGKKNTEIDKLKK